MIGKERRSTESLCEKSMLLLANIIKLSSSLSFAKTANKAAAAAGSTPAQNPAAVAPLIPGTRRLQKPQSRAKPIYVTKPGGGGFQIHSSPRYSSSNSSNSSNSSPSYVYEESGDFEEANVDGWASEYIEKVHKKNRKDSDDQTAIKKPYSAVTSRHRRARASSVLN